jgi:abortive infection bacteriophage resistance protein
VDGDVVKMSTDYIPKSINVLMRHLRNDCHININGSQQKQLLIKYGFYHGYKGYRFFKERTNTIPYSDFEQIISVINYDQCLKTVFYPSVMTLEMVSKNIVVNKVTEDLPDASFDTVYKLRMNDELGNAKLRLHRLQLRDKIYTMLSRNYGATTRYHASRNSQDIMVSHFYSRGDDVPLWSIFEMLSLGDFALFCSCLNKNIRKTILTDIGMDSRFDTNSQLLSNSLYMIRGLRNSIAHNNVIFDTRFADRGNNNSVVSWLEDEVSISNIEFDNISDYLLLLCALSKKMNCNSDMLSAMAHNFESCCAGLRENVPDEIYDVVVSPKIATNIHEIYSYLAN